MQNYAPYSYRYPVKPVPEIKPEEKPSNYWKKTFVYIFVFLFFIFSAWGVYYLVTKPSQPATPEQLMDLRIKNLDKEVEYGGMLKYDVEAMNLGTAEIYDITLQYDIMTLDEKYYPTYRKRETVALSSRSTFSQSFNVNLPAGEYQVRVMALYGNQRAVATDSFAIVRNVSVEVPDNTETPTRDTIPENNLNLNPELITGLADDKLEKDAKAYVKSNPQKSIQYCMSISNAYNVDICLSECAELGNDYRFCDAVGDSDKKDNCYMTLALKGMKTLCNKISNGYKKNTCLAVS